MKAAPWFCSFAAACSSLAAHVAGAQATPANLSDLPLVEVPARGNAPQFAILLSGDGGWAGLDKHVSAALAARGVPVVGLDSLRYFWSARTPEGVAKDVDRVLSHYASQWNRQQALLIGYSQGANVLPFAFNRLPEGSQQLVVQNVMISLSRTASFQFHVSNWIRDDPQGIPILPEVEKLKAAGTLCIYGKDDDSLCPDIPPANARVEAFPGGHHLDGAYDKVADLILAGVPGAEAQ